MSTSTSGLDFSWFESEPVCSLCGSLERIPASNELLLEIDVLNKKLVELNRLRVESDKLRAQLSKPLKKINTNEYQTQIYALKVKIQENNVILSRGTVTTVCSKICCEYQIVILCKMCHSSRR